MLSARKPAMGLPVWFPLLGAGWGPGESLGSPCPGSSHPPPLTGPTPGTRVKTGFKKSLGQSVGETDLHEGNSFFWGAGRNRRDQRDSEGRALGASPPRPGPLSSSPSSLTTQVCGSSESWNVGPGGHRGSALSPGVQALLLAPQRDLCLSFLHSRDLGPVWPDPGSLSVGVCGSDHHPLLHWKQQQCWRPWCRLAPTAPWGCPQTPHLW